MLWPERFVQGHKRQTDRAIHRASKQLASDPLVFDTFHQLLHFTRKQAPRLFAAPILDGRHPGVDALLNLARFRTSHLRAISEWNGSPSSWRPAVSSLAAHLTCRYDVPIFLASCWYAQGSTADTQRAWFVEHSRGASFRSLDLPIRMTRKMEHIFLASPDHLGINLALRRAELLALRMPSGFISAILSTRLATDLRHGDFWRTVWLFLIANARDVEPAQIGPMIDYLQAVRHDRVTLETWQGMVGFDPPQPAFSMKGRTVPSILRLMQGWHRSLGATGGPAVSWAPSPFEPWLVEEPARERGEPPRHWQMIELTNSAQLRQEGVALHHCVASYASVCRRGQSSIWSLRLWQGERVHPVLTVEVDPSKRAVVQARGFANRSPSGKSLRLLQNWAVREKLHMTI